MQTIITSGIRGRHLVSNDSTNVMMKDVWVRHVYQGTSWGSGGGGR